MLSIQKHGCKKIKKKKTPAASFLPLTRLRSLPVIRSYPKHAVAPQSSLIRVAINTDTANFLPSPDFTDNMISLELSNPDSKLPSERYIFLHSLIAQTQDRAIIRSELLNILLAGRDTTASLLSNLIWELSRTPPLVTNLCHEIATHIGSKNEVPTYAQLKDMKYLRALINEGQRMYPIVPSNEREALHNNILPRGGGSDGSAPILVPKGCYVAFHTWSLHRRTDIYGPDAHVFNPDRWLNEENPLRPGWAYIPFSGGPRVCIGQNFALTETIFVVVRLLQFFEFESRDHEPWREKLSVTCSGLGGCKVGLTPKG